MPSGSTQCSCRIHAGKATRIEAINVNQRKEKKGPMNIRERGVMKGEEAEESWGPGERWGWGSGTAPGADGWISADGDRGPEKRKRDGGHSEESTVSCLSTPLFPLVLLLRARSWKTPLSSAFPSFSFLFFWKAGTGHKAALTSTGVQYQELAPPL